MFMISNNVKDQPMRTVDAKIRLDDVWFTQRHFCPSLPLRNKKKDKK